MKSFLLALIGGIAAANIYRFDVEPSYDHYGTRGLCLTFHLPPGQLATGKVEIKSDKRTSKTGVAVYDNQGNQLFAQPDLDGESRFSFQSNDMVAANYDVCVRSLPKAGVSNVSKLPKASVMLEISWTYDLFNPVIAENFKLNPIKTEFFHLEESIRRIADDLASSVRNEEVLRDTNESTLNRVNWFSLFSVVFLVGLGLWQIFYLKTFFKSKKLI